MKMRNKLMAASLMLVVSILMMSTASFAWFTISTAPEVEGLSSSVVVNDNLEIAFATSGSVPENGAAGDTTKQNTWGNVIVMTDTTSSDEVGGYSAATFIKTLRPMTYDTTNKAFTYPTYGTDGRINTFESFAEVESIGAHTWTAGEKTYGYFFDIWVRTNVAGNIELQTAKDVVLSTGSSEKGAGSNIRISASADGKLGENGLQMAADNLVISSRVIGSSDLGYTTAVDGGTVAYSAIEKAAKLSEVQPVAFTKVVNNTDKGEKEIMYDLSGTVVENAKANTAYLVRIYVYLDGAKITNAAASLSEATISGAINLQFKNGATTSMDASTVK